MSGTFYFGTKDRMTWIKCPDSGMPRNRAGWSANGTYLNGGGYQRSSGSNHFEPTLTWAFARQSEVSEIMAYYHQAYGDGVIYFIDPFAGSMNVLPPYLSIPWLAFNDAPSWVTNRRPTKAATTANALDLPTQSAVYTLVAGDTFLSYYIPVPAGYTLWLGVYGSASGTAQMTLNGSAVPLLAPTDSTRFNTSVTTNATLTVQGAGTLTLTALSAVVLPTGTSPTPGNFNVGDGHSGCRFKDNGVQVVGYSSPDALDYQSVTASMIETGIWE